MRHYADDLLAVIDNYRKNAHISSDLVGVLGHSQGAGWFLFFEPRFVRNIFQYNPVKAISELEIPTLIVLGEYDNMAESEKSIMRLQELFPRDILSILRFT